MYIFIDRFFKMTQCNSLSKHIWLLAGLLLWTNTYSLAARSPYEWSLIDLDYVRSEKYEQLNRLCQQLHSKASDIRKDDIMLDFFQTSLNLNDLTDTEIKDPEAINLRKELSGKLEEFRQIVHLHYVKDYISFHDVMFVSLSGEILESLRKENKCGTNILTGTLKDSPLAKSLKQAKGRELFVDFFSYSNASKPAAFFIEAAFNKDKQLGWFVLQLSLNKFNSLFTGHEHLTPTGETFLVNRNGYLLTESSFVGDATILKRKLDDRNIGPKFEAHQGHRIVVDYRGIQVLTSFVVYDFMGTEWLIVAKVDEAEVLTNYFMEHYNFFYNKLPQKLSAGIQYDGNWRPNKSQRNYIMVDMDEFVKAESNDWLETVGVSSCTALLVTFPDRFGYLAHISPQDQMYGQQGTNLLGNLFKKVMYYDVYPYERRGIKITVVANHLKSLRKILDKLTTEGFLLSQIWVLYDPEAESVNVAYDLKQDMFFVKWLENEDIKKNAIFTISPQNNLETIFKEMIDSPSFIDSDKVF